MKNKVYTLISFLIILSVIVGCKTTTIKKVVTHTEMEEPSVDTISEWNKVNPGLNGTVVSIDAKPARSVFPKVEQQNAILLTGWKGETVSAQILLWNSEATENVQYNFSEFISQDKKLASSIAQARIVRYVMSEKENYKCEVRSEGEFMSVLMPDMLDTLSSFDMNEKETRPVWITIQIPSDAIEGLYKCTLQISAKEQKKLEFQITLNVQNRTLPPASEWQYHLDLWQHPSAVARVSNVELWSDSHFEKMKPIMKMLANAGQKVITVTLNKDPWNNQCYDSYDNMITWTKNEDGSWEYDYKVFDRWVEFMMNTGINKMINCYSMLPWNNELEYFDAKSDSVVNVIATPGTPEFESLWTPFLRDFVKHLEEKTWLDITNIAMDERSPEMMAHAVAMLNKEAPKLGISLADNHKSYQKYPLIKDICVKANAKVAKEDIEFRKQHGLITTYYVCCSDPFPNMFTFSPSNESCYSAWYSYAAGYDGFLRWAFNSWPENPVTDSRFRKFPAGDTYFVYPEARSSIRFERLIEGIQDVEKIRILKKEFENDSSLEAKEKQELLDETVQKFNVIGKPETSVSTMLRKAKDVVNYLSE